MTPRLVTMVLFWSNRVYPSAGARTTSWVPILPEAPALLSTTTPWPQAFCKPAPIWRARMSEPPPVAYGTTMRTDLDG